MKHLAVHALVPVLVCLSAPLAATQAAEALEAKQVAAPAADIVAGLVRLPDPAALVQRSDVALIPLAARLDSAGGRFFETRVPVEVAGPLAIAFVSPDVQRWRVLVGEGEQRLRTLDDLQRAGTVRRDAGWVAEGSAWLYDGVLFPDAQAGTWLVRIELPPASAASEPECYVAVRSAGPYRLESHLTTLELFADRAIGVALRLRGIGPGGESLAFDGSVAGIAAQVSSAFGTVELAAHDDGRHEDGAAGDGEFGLSLPAGLSGDVTVELLVRGRTHEGRTFLRSARHAFTVLERRALLAGDARGTLVDGTHLELEIGTWILGEPQKLQVSAEVWAERQDIGFVPVCWLSRMVQPELAGSARGHVELELDGRWLDLARAGGRVELRELRLQDPGTHLPFHVLERVAVDGPPASSFAGTFEAEGAAALPREMLMGRASSGAGSFADVAPVPFTRSLMLVHGWCSGGSVWPAAHFTSPKVEFLDPNANRTHDEFALLLRALGNGLGSFGIVGHSQGGMAALHLYTYYWSGLDQARGPRRIQSVGTPYQGTPLASLGFFACGTNNDLTTAGAATWLAGIPSWARAEVYYWTTSNSGSVCNFFTNIVLGGTNDGVTRQDLNQLPGGNSMGHKTGWCHTTGMSNPAQYLDAVRNGQMNANAAR